MRRSLSPGTLIAVLSTVLPAGETVVYLDGREVAGRVLDLKEEALVLEGVDGPVPLQDLSAIVFNPPTTEVEAEPNAGPISVFRSGEVLHARVLKAGVRTAQLEVSGLKLDVPTEALKAFRLRETHKGDGSFELDLKSPTPPARDRVYVRRGDNLLRIEGVLESLDEELLTLEYEGQARKLRRQLVQGVILAPVASPRQDKELPALFELRRGGQFPAWILGIRCGAERQLLVRFRGAGAGEMVPIATKAVSTVRLASDRSVFLSALAPAKIEETPLFGVQPAFPWRSNLAVSGSPLKLGGRTYPTGLGMTSRSALEYEIGGNYRTFSALIGLDESAGTTAGVTFRVIVDSKELYSREMLRATKPEALVLPLDGVRRLRLEVDYGRDGVDFGDYANWADARLAR